MNLDISSINIEKTLSGEENFDIIEELLTKIINERGVIKIDEREDGAKPVFTFSNEPEKELSFTEFLNNIISIVSTGIVQRNAMKGLVLANRKSLYSRGEDIGRNLFLTGTEVYIGLFEGQIACIVKSEIGREIYKGVEIMHKLKDMM